MSIPNHGLGGAAARRKSHRADGRADLVGKAALVPGAVVGPDRKIIGRAVREVSHGVGGGVAGVRVMAV
jgi:hypothetical protein